MAAAALCSSAPSPVSRYCQNMKEVAGSSADLHAFGVENMAARQRGRVLAVFQSAQTHAALELG